MSVAGWVLGVAAVGALVTAVVIFGDEPLERLRKRDRRRFRTVVRQAAHLGGKRQSADFVGGQLGISTERARAYMREAGL